MAGGTLSQETYVPWWKRWGRNTLAFLLKGVGYTFTFLAISGISGVGFFFGTIIFTSMLAVHIPIAMYLVSTFIASILFLTYYSLLKNQVIGKINGLLKIAEPAIDTCAEGETERTILKWAKVVMKKTNYLLLQTGDAWHFGYIDKQEDKDLIVESSEHDLKFSECDGHSLQDILDDNERKLEKNNHFFLVYNRETQEWYLQYKDLENQTKIALLNDTIQITKSPDQLTALEKIKIYDSIISRYAPKDFKKENPIDYHNNKLLLLLNNSTEEQRRNDRLLKWHIHSTASSYSNALTKSGASASWNRKVLLGIILPFAILGLVVIGLTGHLGIMTMALHIGWSSNTSSLGYHLFNIFGILSGISMAMSFGALFIPDIIKHVLVKREDDKNADSSEDSATPKQKRSKKWINRLRFLFAFTAPFAFAAFKGFSFAHFLIMAGLTSSAYFPPAIIFTVAIATISLFILTASTSSVKLWRKFKDWRKKTPLDRANVLNNEDERQSLAHRNGVRFGKFLARGTATMMAGGVLVSFYPILNILLAASLHLLATSSPFIGGLAIFGVAVLGLVTILATVCRFVEICIYYEPAVTAFYGNSFENSKILKPLKWILGLLSDLIALCRGEKADPGMGDADIPMESKSTHRFVGKELQKGDIDAAALPVVAAANEADETGKGKSVAESFAEGGSSDNFSFHSARSRSGSGSGSSRLSNSDHPLGKTEPGTEELVDQSPNLTVGSSSG